MNYENFNLKQNQESNTYYSLLDCINNEINFNELLEKYGPEGLYVIAKKLKELADEDIRDALNQCNNEEFNSKIK